MGWSLPDISFCMQSAALVFTEDAILISLERHLRFMFSLLVFRCMGWLCKKEFAAVDFGRMSFVGAANSSQKWGAGLLNWTVFATDVLLSAELWR